MATFKLFSPVLDFGLNTLDTDANKIVICSTEPTTYTEASATFKLGEKSFGAGGCFGTPGTYSGGRTIASTGITNGTITTSGTPACWAVIDDANSRLLASGPMTGAAAVTAGQQFTLASFTIDQPSGAAFPMGGASVDLWFSTGSYYPSAPTNFLSLTRASSAYAKNADGTLTSFASNVMRIGAGSGLYHEEPSTNLVLQSQTLGSFNTINGGTITADATTAPDGTTTADKFVEDGTNARHAIFNNAVAIANPMVGHTVSMFVKKINRNYCYLGMSDPGGSGVFWSAVFDLANGVVGEKKVGASGGQCDGSWIEAFANGWYRVSAKGELPSPTTSAYFLFGGAGAATGNTFETGYGFPTYVGGSSDAFYMWGLQAEQFDWATTYIPTTTSSVARAGDAIFFTSTAQSVLTGSNFSIVEELICTSGSPNQTGILVCANSESASYMYIGGGVSSYNNGVIVIATVGGFANFGPPGMRAGFAMSAGVGRSVCVGGGTVVGDANSIVGATPRLGHNASAWTGDSQYVRRLTLWPTRLADGTLQSLTAPD